MANGVFNRYAVANDCTILDLALGRTGSGLEVRDVNRYSRPELQGFLAREVPVIKRCQVTLQHIRRRSDAEKEKGVRRDRQSSGCARPHPAFCSLGHRATARTRRTARQ